MFMEHNPGVIKKVVEDDGKVIYRNYYVWSASLPTDVIEWLGFRTSSGYFNPNQSLSKLNDNGTPFTEIAKLFRNPPEGLLE